MKMAKESDIWIPLFTSEVKHDTLSPSFDPFVLDISALSNGGTDWNSLIQLAVSYSEEPYKLVKPTLVGATVLSLREFLTGSAKEFMYAPAPPPHSSSHADSWGSFGGGMSRVLSGLSSSNEVAGPDGGTLTANANQAVLTRTRTISRLSHGATATTMVGAGSKTNLFTPSKDGATARAPHHKRPQAHHPDIPLYKATETAPLPAMTDKNTASTSSSASSTSARGSLHALPSAPSNKASQLPPPIGFVCVKSVALLESLQTYDEDARAKAAGGVTDAFVEGSAGARLDSGGSIIPGPSMALRSASRRSTATAADLASLRAVSAAAPGVAALAAAASPAVASGTVKRFATLASRENAGPIFVGASATNGGDESKGIASSSAAVVAAVSRRSTLDRNSSVLALLKTGEDGVLGPMVTPTKPSSGAAALASMRDRSSAVALASAATAAATPSAAAEPNRASSARRR